MPEDTKTILGDTQDQSGIQPDSTINLDNKSTSDNNSDKTGNSYDYTQLLASDGALNENWRDCLPEDIRNEPSLNSIKHFGALAKSYVAAQKMVGANKIALPGEHATPEELNTFYKALGRPDSADKYSVEDIEIPKGFALDDAQVKEFREFAFNNGLNQKTFAAAVAFDLQRARKEAEEEKARSVAEYNSSMNKLEAAWGRKFEQNLAQCNAAMNKWNLTEIFRSAGLLNNYQLITAMAEIGAAISESKLKGDNFNTPQDPKAELDRILGDMNHPLYKKDHPAHEAAVKQVNELLAQQARLEQAAR